MSVTTSVFNVTKIAVKTKQINGELSGLMTYTKIVATDDKGNKFELNLHHKDNEQYIFFYGDD